MKKLIKLSILLVVMVLFCTACEGDVTRALRHDGFNLSGDIVCEAFIGDNAVERVGFLTGTHIITSEGRIYELSLGQPYSNKSNCRVADTSLKVVAMFDDKIIKADDGKYYALINQNNGGGAYQQISENDNAYAIYDLLLKPEGTVKAVTADSNTGIYYVLKSDGNVYGVTINKQNSNTPPTITGSAIVYNQTDFGGTIVDFNYYGNNSATFVRTTTQVFHMSATNYDQCSKFADVECDYQMMEATSFAEYGDYILAYNGSTVITTYGKVFNAA